MTLSNTIDQFSAGGGFFKPAEHAAAVAILFVPTRFEANHPGYMGELKDTLWADYYIFSTPKAVEDGTPSLEMHGASNTNAAIVSRGKAMMDKKVPAQPLKLEKEHMKNGKTAWIPKPVPNELMPGLSTFWDKKRAEAEEANAALDALLD